MKTLEAKELEIKAGDTITFREGDYIPEKVYFDEDFNCLCVDSYHAFFLLSYLTDVKKVE